MTVGHQGLHCLLLEIIGCMLVFFVRKSRVQLAVQMAHIMQTPACMYGDRSPLGLHVWGPLPL